MSEASSNSHGSTLRGESGCLLTPLQIIRNNQHVVTSSSRLPNYLTNEDFIDLSVHAGFQQAEPAQNDMVCPDNIADMLIIVRE